MKTSLHKPNLSSFPKQMFQTLTSTDLLIDTFLKLDFTFLKSFCKKCNKVKCLKLKTDLYLKTKTKESVENWVEKAVGHREPLEDNVGGDEKVKLELSAKLEQVILEKVLVQLDRHPTTVVEHYQSAD